MHAKIEEKNRKFYINKKIDKNMLLYI